MLHDCSEQQICMELHMSLFHIMGLKLGPHIVQSVPFLKHLQKFHLDLCSLRYNNSPHVSCLGMNPGRGWNPNVEGSYLLEYSESEAEIWTKCKLGFYLQSVSFSTLDPSQIPRYSECTKTYQF